MSTHCIDVCFSMPCLYCLPIHAAAHCYELVLLCSLFMWCYFAIDPELHYNDIHDDTNTMIVHLIHGLRAKLMGGAVHDLKPTASYDWTIYMTGTLYVDV